MQQISRSLLCSIEFNYMMTKDAALWYFFLCFIVFVLEETAL